MWFPSWLKKLSGVVRLSGSKRYSKRRTKRIHGISLETTLKPISPIPGEWDSIFKGRGQQFSGFKEFHPSDNPSLIDIPRFATTGEMFIVERIPRRGIEVTIVMDFSSSCSVNPAPDIRDNAALLIAAAAVKMDSPLALVGFGADIHFKHGFDSPRIQFKRLADKIQEQNTHSNSSVMQEGTSFSSVVPYIRNVTPQNSLVFLISDFLGGDGLTELLSIMRGRVDCTPVLVDTSPIWEDMPLGRFELRAVDPETGKVAEMFLTPSKIREIREFHRERKERLASMFRRNGFYHATLNDKDPESCVRALTVCFKQKMWRRQ